MLWQCHCISCKCVPIPVPYQCFLVFYTYVVFKQRSHDSPAGYWRAAETQNIEGIVDRSKELALAVNKAAFFSAAAIASDPVDPLAPMDSVSVKCNYKDKSTKISRTAYGFMLLQKISRDQKHKENLNPINIWHHN